MRTDLTPERIAELVRESGFVNHLSDSFKDWCDPPDYCRRCLRAALAHILAREAELLPLVVDAARDFPGTSRLSVITRARIRLQERKEEAAARKRIEEEQG